MKKKDVQAYIYIIFGCFMIYRNNLKSLIKILQFRLFHSASFPISLLLFNSVYKNHIHLSHSLQLLPHSLQLLPRNPQQLPPHNPQFPFIQKTKLLLSIIPPQNPQLPSSYPPPLFIIRDLRKVPWSRQMKYPKGQVHSDRDVDGDSSQQCNITLFGEEKERWVGCSSPLKKCEYSVHDACTCYAFKTKKILKHVSYFCPKHNKWKYVIMISLSFYFITFFNLSRLKQSFLFRSTGREPPLNHFVLSLNNKIAPFSLTRVA